MATPSELSLSEIRKYLIDNGGLVRNRELVKYFKSFLTDPETRVDARNKFKEYVNELATIKSDEDEKYLVLKKKYRPNGGELGTLSHPHHSTIQTTQDIQNSPSSPVSPLRDPPPYRSPPPAPSPSTDGSPSCFSPPEQLYATVNKPNRIAASVSADQLHQQSIQDGRNRKGIIEVSDTIETVSSPPVPPRRKSQDKLKQENKENIHIKKEKSDNDSVSKECTISTPDLPSVRERMQRFNRMASETDIHGRATSVAAQTKKRSDKGADEEDAVSVVSQLDGKAREWLVRAAQGDYQALAKLAAEEPRLTRLKDPSSGYTALHWGAKHGDENIVKLIAGTYKDYIKNVNGTTNGGYTALHLAMQFDHENIFNLLVQVYGANQEIRDHSGKKARQYVASQEAAVSQDTFRKIKARKKHTEKDLGFLRIGSLNVRVKRTTEAFSQFLGVASSTNHNHEKIHKSWGSADNIQEHKMMPPPRYAPIKKRRSKRAQDFISSRGHVASQPTTPLPQTKDLIDKNTKLNNKRPSSTTAITPITSVISHDSDSDGACGFDSAWRGSAQL